MLRLLTERLSIYLHPEKVVLIRETGIFKRKILAKKVLPVSASSNSASWIGVVQALRIALDNPDLKGLRATIILSGHFVKYRVADWHEMLSIEEQVTLFQHRFKEIYGQQATGWNVFISNTGFKKNELACAVDGELLSALHGLFEKDTARLISIQPFLTVAVNLWRKHIKESTLLVVIENGHIHFSRFSEGGWSSIRSKEMTNPSEQLAVLFEREMLQTDGKDQCPEVYFFWPENPGYKPSIPSTKELSVLTLKSFSGFSEKIDANVAAAVCVAI